MATQIKPLTSGSFTTVNTDGAKRVQKTSTGMPASPNMANAMRGINMWLNVAGAAGSVTTAAQKVAHAQGIVLQEV